MQDYGNTIDVSASVSNVHEMLNKVLSEQDYGAALRLYNSKGIPAYVAKTLGIDKWIYLQMILGILRKDPNGTVANAMRAAIQ